jgi:23S rRNA pseudouridine1911/1915/1917 synthase
MESFIVAEEAKGERLDRFLAERTGLSRAEVQRLIRAGLVRVGGRTAKPSYLLKPGEYVELEPSTARLGLSQPQPQPEALPLRIIYEDDDLIVVDKPAGLVTHPAPGHLQGTLLNALLHHCQLAETGDPLRPGIVHRLDRETSGALVAAKTRVAYQSLVEQFKRGEVGKSYLALVHGAIEEDEGLIELPLRRASLRREEIAVDAAGKGAITEFFVLGRFPAAGKTLVEARPRDGADPPAPGPLPLHRAPHRRRQEIRPEGGSSPEDDAPCLAAQPLASPDGEAARVHRPSAGGVPPLAFRISRR